MRAAFGGIVRVDRLRIRIPGHGKSISRNPKAVSEQFEHGDTSGRGQVPIAAEPAVVDRRRIRVALQLDGVWNIANGRGDFLDAIEPRRGDFVASGREKCRLTKTDHKTSGVGMNFNFAG